MKSLSFLKSPHGDMASFYQGRLPLGKGDFPLVIFAHGFPASATMAESLRLFYKAAQYFEDNGFSSLLFDFIGHGLSDGEYQDVTPNSKLRDVSWVIENVTAQHQGSIFLLGFSMGGAVAIHAATRYQEKLAGLLTWSTVPSFDPDNACSGWFSRNTDETRVDCISPRFTTDRPAVSVGDAYQSLRLPKFQIQGSNDIPFFIEEFRAFYAQAPEPKEHVVLDGADHIFSNTSHRDEVFQKSVAWMKRHLSKA